MNLELPESRFCLNTAAALWDLELLDIPSHVQLSGASRGHTGRSRPTTSAALMPSGFSGLEGLGSYGIARHGPQAAAVLHNGLLVTPLPETVVSVIARENFAAGTVLADHAIGMRRTSGPAVGKDELLALAARLESGARRRWATQVLDFAVTNSGSAGESLSRAQIHLLGFPAPLLQASFHIGGRFVARTDFFWPRFKLVGEFDGDAKYLRDEYLGHQTARQTVLAEKKREDKLRAAGFRVARWDWAIASDAPRLAALLRNAGLPSSGSRNKSTP
ncbi:endonuclease domain-containing protein [Arthrobacter sp. 9AX]|uniref:endonuclease domain-containing protein n=1 Tax=Arthrobacter sp. 9AX TaxID=2653131 RepID=UPI001F1979F5|nr:endonuclease domain-containing protein [Arthrobacter sp. 9AX]